MKNLLFIALTSLFITTISAMDSLFLSLDEAILLAIENNSSLAIERLNPAIAGTQVRAESAIFDPALSISGNLAETKSPASFGSGETASQITNKEQYRASLGFALPTGTSVSAEMSVTGDMPESSPDQWSSVVGLTVSQSLLKGISPGYNLARLRKAKLDVEISELELKALGENVVASVESAYWSVYLAGKELEIRNRSLELARQQLSESEERIRVGKLAEIELAAIHAEVAIREAALIDAQNRMETARLTLLYLINPPAQNVWSLCPVPTDLPTIPTDTIDGVELHDSLAMIFRPDLAQARLLLEKNSLDVIRTRNGLLPRLDAFVGLGRSSYASSFDNASADFQSPYYSVSGGLTLEFPVTLRQARAEHARSKFTREQLRLAVDNMERLVLRDIRTAYAEISRARKQIDATGVAVSLQERKLEAELEKFRVGKSTNFQVLQAQRDYIESELSRARATVAYLNALVDIYLMDGTLLERRGISLH